MSHTHFCDIAGHPWQCESSECICICQVQMEQGDHSRCSIELRACFEHDGSLPEETAGGRSATRTEQEGWGRLKPNPPEIEEKFGKWAASESESIGFCFLCGNPILTDRDFIPDRNTHDCAEGRLFEEKICTRQL
jgi:hypothetical protein